MAGRRPAQGLTKTTKSIPLSGGMSEEVDDFLLEPGAMQYMENVRYTKKDRAEKAEPWASVAATGLTNYSFDAYGAWSKGSDIAFITNDSLGRSTDGGTTWDVSTHNMDVLGIEKLVSTPGIEGGCNFVFCPMGGYVAGQTFTPTHYAVAFERLRAVINLSHSRDIVMQVYTAEGHLTNEVIYSGGCGPRLQPTDGSGALLLFVDTANNDIVQYSTTAASEVWTAGSTYARTIRTYCQFRNTTDSGWGNAGAALSAESTRLGFAQNMLQYNSSLCYSKEIGATSGVIAYKVGTTISWEQTTGAIPSGTVQPLAVDGGSVRFAVLDCATDGTANYFLIASQNTTAYLAATELFIYREAVGGGAVTTWSIDGTYNAPVVNGSLVLNGSGTAFAAVTFSCAGLPTARMIDLEAGGQALTRVYALSSLTTLPGTLDDSREIYNHRLISNIAIDQNDYPNFVLQQWGNFNPGEVAITADPLIPTLTPVHHKPMTSIQARWRSDVDELDLVASYDAAQSKAMPPSIEEQNTSLGSLYYFEGTNGTEHAQEFWFGNRNLLVSEDDFYFLANTAARAWPASDAVEILTPGTARLNIYHIAPTLSVHSVDFDNGVFIGASLPLWYDGGTNVMEIAPLESPEITFVDSGTANVPTYVAYQDLGQKAAKVIQVVMGYYDDTGAIHRSAPSVPVYAGGTTKTDTNNPTLTVRVTVPLSVARTRPYFLEVYEALSGEVPRLAATKTLDANDASSIAAITWRTAAGPMGGATVDVSPYRTAKSLYTSGSVLAADPWPAFDAVVKSGRRLFAHALTDPSTIYYSKIYENGIVPEFSAALTVTLGNETITALGNVDDKLIAFTDRTMYLVYGVGPDNTGANGDFLVEKFPHAHGCTDQDSIVSYQDGIAFLSSTTGEIVLLSRDMQVASIGEAVESITGDPNFTIQSALDYPAGGEIRWYYNLTARSEYLAAGDSPSSTQPPRPWLQSSPPTAGYLAYNYGYGKWSVVDVGTAIPYTALIRKSDGKPCGLYAWNFYENGTDWSVSKRVTLETPWIKVNQLQDFGRFYGATLLAKYQSSWNLNGGATEAGDLQVTVRYDYEGTDGDTDVIRFRANQDFDPTNGDRLQLEIRPSRQKCQAIKFIFEEIATEKIELSETDYTNGRGFILTALDLHYGAKGGSGYKSIGSPRRRG